MTIDRPQARDLPFLRSLWQEAFGDDDSFLDAFFSTGFSPDRCRCIALEGHLAAALYWFDCSMAGNKLAYIYAVATDRAFRGRGLCRLLMEDTHRHLRALGYSAAVLVPGDPGLFTLYEKLGYRSFCPMQTVSVTRGGNAQRLTKITGADYVRLRKQLLPENSILQEGVTVDFLGTFTAFYAADNAIGSVSREGDTLYFQEYLGDPMLLPGILQALGAEKAVVRVCGGDPYAMYLPLVDSLTPPNYLGISLG